MTTHNPHTWIDIDIAMEDGAEPAAWGLHDVSAQRSVT